MFHYAHLIIIFVLKPFMTIIINIILHLDQQMFSTSR